METERLQFRRYTKGDFPFFASLWADPDVVQFIGKGVTRSTEETLKSFHEASPRLSGGERIISHIT
jgi:hypothetical protein